MQDHPLMLGYEGRGATGLLAHIMFLALAQATGTMATSPLCNTRNTCSLTFQEARHVTSHRSRQERALVEG